MPPLHRPISTATPRLVAYYQTLHDKAGRPISILPLVQRPGISVTHVIVAALHLNDDGGGGGGGDGKQRPPLLTLNDDDPYDEDKYATLWREVAALQAAGVGVLAMLGGAAAGTYARLDFARGGRGDDDDDARRFERHYGPIRDLLRARRLDGVDLDVEEPMSLAGVVRLIDRLRADFGPAFVITLAPVAAALLDRRANLSGFDYAALERARGAEVAWYNAQFYCGWGDARTTALYDAIVARWPSRKVVVGLVTSDENGAGFVAWEELAAVLGAIAARSRRGAAFGGVMGWEYFNSRPGGRAAPWVWARRMTGLIRGHCVAPLVPGEEEEEDGEEVEGGGLVVMPACFEYFSDGDDDDEEEGGDGLEMGDGAWFLGRVPDSFEYFSEGERI